MRQILPSPIEAVDLFDAYRPADPTAPLLRVNMVMSADGRATDRTGRTGELGRPGDKQLFRALRAMADAILVGAGTARAESYGPHRMTGELRERRLELGRPLAAPLVLVSRSLELDWESPMFTEAERPTVVMTCDAAPRERRGAAARAAMLVIAGDETVDLELGLATLRREFGFAHVLCEGGPTLNEPLFELGLVDELCLTLTPLLVGTETRGILPSMSHGAELELVQLLEEEGELYLRYALGRA
jgi:riboflavin biosynthesis pyrimidine reductase